MRSSLKIIVEHPAGLHARPASLFVKTAKNYSSDIQIRNMSDKCILVNAKSILGVLTLGVMQGHEIEIIAEGEDASLAINAFEELIHNNFGEE